MSWLDLDSGKGYLRSVIFGPRSEHDGGSEGPDGRVEGVGVHVVGHALRQLLRWDV